MAIFDDLIKRRALLQTRLAITHGEIMAIIKMRIHLDAQKDTLVVVRSQCQEELKVLAAQIAEAEEGQRNTAEMVKQ